jgi:hypothetical protein
VKLLLIANQATARLVPARNHRILSGHAADRVRPTGGGLILSEPETTPVEDSNRAAA